MISDEALYARLLAGDEPALESLLHRYHAPLLRFLYRHTGDPHRAEDLVQETFARVVTYQGEPPRRFRAWAFTIAANLARDHLRSAYQRREQPDPLQLGDEASPLLTDAGPGADELALRSSDRREVVAALQALSASHREVVVLRFYHDMSLEEIAAVTGAPLGTVKSRLFHALKHLKATLDPEGGQEHERAQTRRPGGRA